MTLPHWLRPRKPRECRKQRAQGYESEFRVCVALARRGPLSSGEVARVVRCHMSIALKHLSRLIEDGRVSMSGFGHGRRYRLVPDEGVVRVLEALGPDCSVEEWAERLGVSVHEVRAAREAA